MGQATGEEGRLAVSDLHTLHWSRCGAADGIPVVVIHGGPGSASTPAASAPFDPAVWSIVAWDQRGCGRSTPLGEIRDNTTAHLLEDLERLRIHLAIDRWVVMGGSWGTTVALAYLRRHPERCLAVLLRGVTEWSRRKYEWALAHRRFLAPDAWEALTRGLDDVTPQGIVAHHRARVEAGDVAAARRWKDYERRFEQPDLLPPIGGPDDATALAASRIQLHYWANGGFVCDDDLYGPPPADVPVVIVHGRLDFVCPPLFADAAQRRLPGADLVMVDGAGHGAGDPLLAPALRREAERLARRLRPAK